MSDQETRRALPEPPKGELVQSAILGDLAIARRLKEKHLLVFPGVEDEDLEKEFEPQLKRSRYFLRLSRGPLVVPVPKSVSKSGFRYYDGKDKQFPENHDIVLQPGDAAVVSTMEHFRMPYDVSGSLGLRFQQARRGLLALMGPTADPGFGWSDDPTRGEPLHLLLANMSTRAISLRPGDPLVSVEFLRIADADPTQEPRIEVSGAMEEEWYRDAEKFGPELAYIGQLRETRAEVDDLTKRFNRVEDSIDRYGVVGVFAIAAAMIFAFVGALSGLLKDIRLDEVSQNVPDVTWPVGVVATAALLFGIFYLPYRAFHIVEPKPVRPGWLPRLGRRKAAIRSALVLLGPDERATAHDISLAAFGRSSKADLVRRVAESEPRFRNLVKGTGSEHVVTYDVLVERMRLPGARPRRTRPERR
jgi:deoxycytidine triphosphate deaminase